MCRWAFIEKDLSGAMSLVRQDSLRALHSISLVLNYGLSEPVA